MGLWTEIFIQTFFYTSEVPVCGCVLDVFVWMWDVDHSKEEDLEDFVFYYMRIFILMLDH